MPVYSNNDVILRTMGRGEVVKNVLGLPGKKLTHLTWQSACRFGHCTNKYDPQTHFLQNHLPSNAVHCFTTDSAAHLLPSPQEFAMDAQCWWWRFTKINFLNVLILRMGCQVMRWKKNQAITALHLAANSVAYFPWDLGQLSLYWDNN